MTPTEFMRAYEAATRAHDLRRTLDLIGSDAIYWFSDGGSHVGRAAIERALRRNFEAIEGEDYRISDIVWVAQSPECAVCTYRFDWSGTVRGTRASGAGRGTSVLARRGELWAVVHEHLSRGPATG